MSKSREFPRSQVRGQKQHAFAARQGALEVLESVVDHDLADILTGVLGEKTDFRQLASEGSKNAPEDPGALTAALLRKCQREVAHAHPPQPDVQQVDLPSESDACGPGQRTRQGSDEFDDQPGERVLESLTHVGGNVTLAPEKSYVKPIPRGLSQRNDRPYLLAALAHLASVSRNGYASFGASISP